MVRYTEYPLARDMAHRIECIWILEPVAESGSGTHHRVFPDGASDIVMSGGRALVQGRLHLEIAAVCSVLTGARRNAGDGLEYML